MRNKALQPGRASPQHINVMAGVTVQADVVESIHIKQDTDNRQRCRGDSRMTRASREGAQLMNMLPTGGAGGKGYECLNTAYLGFIARGKWTAIPGEHHLQERLPKVKRVFGKLVGS